MKDELVKRDEALAVAKREEAIRLIKRRGNIDAWNDYIGFGLSKAVGLGAAVLGGIGTIAPQLLPFALSRSEYVAGVGLALLTGKSVLSLIAKAEKVIKK